MALVHNIIIRGWNSIYLQAPKIKIADVPDFLHYCDAYHAFVVGHHDSEEAVLFPKIEEATGLQRVMDDDVAEHGKSLKIYSGLGFKDVLNWRMRMCSCFSRWSNRHQGIR
jgi:hemerythrin-like domain-containing protein